MALDGIFLSAINLQLQCLIGSRVNRIIQVSKFEVVFEFRKPGFQKQLLISANPSSARLNFSSKFFGKQNIQTNFCSLLCRRLIGAFLVESKQLGLDRILFLRFRARDEIGNFQEYDLAIEIMGKHSNIILVNRASGQIVDAIKLVDETMSQFRVVEPKKPYFVVERQNKLNLLSCSVNEVFSRVFSNSNLSLSRAFLASIEGVSPVVARELAFGFDEKAVGLFGELEKERVIEVLSDFKNMVESKKFCFVALMEGKKPREFCWFDVCQFGGLLRKKFFESASELLDFFYDEKMLIERINQRCFNVVKLIDREIDKAKNKKAIRQQELFEAKNHDEYRKYGDLLLANIHNIKKGDTKISVADFFEDGREIELSLDAAKTPSQNVKFYYRIYKKSKVARQKLVQLIGDCDDEIRFLQSERDLVLNAQTQQDVLAVVSDLVDQKYYKKTKVRLKKISSNLVKSNFLRFKSSEGFLILCGRSNQQNDYLTTKKAQKTDVWFHVQDYVGSHVIVFSKGEVLSKQTIVEAATVAAVHSSARDSMNVAVDYALVKYVKKPVGSKPGMVIFRNNKTICVDPDKNLVERLKF